MINKSTCIILAGGKSSRMGKDKSFVLFSGKPLIEVVISRVSAVFNKIIIITNKPDMYKRYNAKIYTDIEREKGPLGGIYTGLVMSESKYNFITACDMPLVNADLARFMVKEAEGYDAAVPEFKGRLEPLSAVYSKSCINMIKEQLCSENLAMQCLLDHINLRTISQKECLKYDPRGTSFINMNTVKDYECLTRDF